MKLSDALIFGSTIMRRDPNIWISEDGSCGCAFGGALRAAGVTAEQFHREAREAGVSLGPLDAPLKLPCVQSRWPWLNFFHMSRISNGYHCIEEGLTTMEEIAAYIRSVEPEEGPTPATEITDAESALLVG